jgi:hypothetical protein
LGLVYKNASRDGAALRVVRPEEVGTFQGATEAMKKKQCQNSLTTWPI